MQTLLLLLFHHCLSCTLCLCCSTVWYGVVWFGFVWYGIVWYNNIGCSKNGVVVQRVVHGTVLAHKLKYWEVSFQEHDDVNDVDPS